MLHLFWPDEINLELDEGEKHILTIRHHWMLLLQNGSIPLIIMVITGGIALFRAMGGGLIGTDPDMVNQLDLINIVLLGVLGIMLVLWVRGTDTKLGTKGKGRFKIHLGSVMQFGMLLLALLIWYRYQGGRVFEFNAAVAQPFDLINIILLSITGLAILYFIYVILDWYNDTLTLTTSRIVLDRHELLIRQDIQQILLVDVQQVLMRQNTYPEVILNYGYLTIQTFSVKRIEFRHAQSPQKMESLIKQELTRTRKALEPNLVRRLIDERVFENKPREADKKQFHVETKGAHRKGLLAWLFPANPEIDEKSGQITWRPSSVYVGLMMLRPFLIWFVTTIIVIFISTLNETALLWGAVVWVLVTLVSGFAIFWLREEYVNDVYILSKREIIDVDRRPFGPVKRRSAPIGNIQNVSSDVSFYEQILGYGTVRMQTGGTGDFSFNHVPYPRGVQAMINDYLTDFKKTTEERNLQNNIDVFKEYHFLQREKGELMDQAAIDASMQKKAQAAVDEYANMIAPIQIEHHIHRAMKRSTLLTERRARIQRLIAQRRQKHKPENE